MPVDDIVNNIKGEQLKTFQNQNWSTTDGGLPMNSTVKRLKEQYGFNFLEECF